MRALSAQVWVTEIDPDLARCRRRWKATASSPWTTPATRPTSFVTCTGNVHVIDHDHMAKMKDQAIVCNIGHFDSEINVASLEKYQWEEIKPQVDHVIFPDGKRIILLAKGPPGESGLRHGTPQLCNVFVIRQPDHRTDRVVHAQRRLPGGRSIRCPSTSMKRWLACS